MKRTPSALRAEAAEKIQEAKNLQELADRHGRAISKGEEERVYKLLGEADELQADANCREQIDTRVDRLGQGVGRLTRELGGPQYPMGYGPSEVLGQRGLTFKTSTGEVLRALTASERFSRSDSSLPVEVGDVVRSLLTGKADLAGPEFRAALGGVDPSGGYFLSPEMSTRVIDLARSASVCMRAGAQSVPMNGSELTLIRIAQDATAMWRPEGVDVVASDMLFERISLKPKTLAAVVPISIELAEDAPNASQVIQSALTAAMGQMLDKVALVGTGASSEPLGVRNHASVNTVTSVGTPSDYSKYSSGVQKIMEANFAGDTGSLAWIGHPRDFAKLDILEDSTGQPLNPTPWTSALRKFSTTSLPTNEGSSESVAVIGSFEEMLFGLRTSGVVIRVLESGTVTDSAGVVHNAASQLKRLIVAYLRADVALLRPKFFAVLSGITVT